jgi:hypothetical protein
MPFDCRANGCVTRTPITLERKRTLRGESKRGKEIVT